MSILPLPIIIESTSADDTERTAREFSRILRPGDTVGLTGELGAGKTVFVRGVCSGLEYAGSVTSPTFTLMHAYPTSPPLYHFDCFRMRRPQEMVTTGFEELISLKEGIILVEWADMIRDYFNDWDFLISLNFAPESEERRLIEISSRHPDRMPK
jgi:tRNA threonylcarbamoyladenosine biosynthesis protein TsaE